MCACHTCNMQHTLNARASSSWQDALDEQSWVKRDVARARAAVASRFAARELLDRSVTRRPLVAAAFAARVCIIQCSAVAVCRRVCWGTRGAVRDDAVTIRVLCG